MIDYLRHGNAVFIGRNTSRHNRKDPIESVFKPSFTQLNFGLDVVPSMTYTLPDNLVVKIVCVPLYIFVMAFWFPVLPIIQ